LVVAAIVTDFEGFIICFRLVTWLRRRKLTATMESTRADPSGTVWYGMAWCGMVWHGVPWTDVAWSSVEWLRLRFWSRRFQG